MPAWKAFSLNLIFLSSLWMGCKSQDTSIDVQGHRGARGLYPENTIPAFLKAVELGVNTLELDVVISRDKKVVVSHEPYFSAEICLDPQGEPIPESKDKSLNMYEMPYEQVRRYDCGSKEVARFPQQVKMEVHKPLLKDVFKVVSEKISDLNQERDIRYNIELKSNPDTDKIYHPPPDVFSQIVYHVIDENVSFENVTIQSFDFRILRYWHEHYPGVSLAVLIENNKSIEKNIDKLGFTPDIYSPYFKTLSREKVDRIHNLGMKVIPWTVNEVKAMKKLISWNVDGLITDYPNLLVERVD